VCPGYRGVWGKGMADVEALERVWEDVGAESGTKEKKNVVEVIL
jgi:hypothetical protein